MRIGIYGGSFNPTHIGHIYGAEHALKALALDKLLLIPTNASPGKKATAYPVTPQQRFEMLQLAVPDDPKIEVSDLELRRGGFSYTHETLLQVRQMYPEGELILILGTDMFLSLLDWQYAEETCALASIAVLYRGHKGEKQAIEQQKTVMEERGNKVYLIDNPLIQISSTDLRRMLTFDCADSFLAPAVVDYIRKNGLYGTNTNKRNLAEKELEKQVTFLLKENRVAHVLGCRDTAVELAKKWGADVTDAARAALLHDITKALDGPLQLTLCNAYGMILDKFSTQNPKTLHALTGSLVADRIFGENPAVVAAIRSHTTGKADMNMLEKIIYVADYMEPNRDFPGVEELRRLAYTDINKALKLGLEMTLAMLREQGKEVSTESQQALAFLEAEKG
ncbi:MAG: nicotinate (nicotinamide) nucleotide adenylyltransferase [Oscillospiraceae bacterium]|nr:nicotinate (nicotinamide) nucleotide adenylyltransferase [Oscillospiraceae bacterium]